MYLFLIEVTPSALETGTFTFQVSKKAQFQIHKKFVLTDYYEKLNSQQFHENVFRIFKLVMIHLINHDALLSPT